jgi:transposase-like protein
MPSNNSKYTEEMRERTVLHILNSGKSATSVAEELGIDTNTVCKWVREYRRKNNMPSASEAKHIERASKTINPNDTKRKVKELENRLRQKEKELAEERENVEILKKSLHIFMRARDENARR